MVSQQHSRRLAGVDETIPARELPVGGGARTRKGDETSADSHENVSTQSSSFTP